MSLAYADSAAAIYLEAIKAAVDGEARRRESIETRAIAVATSAAALATIVFTVAGFSLKDGRFTLVCGFAPCSLRRW